MMKRDKKLVDKIWEFTLDGRRLLSLVGDGFLFQIIDFLLYFKIIYKIINNFFEKNKINSNNKDR